MRRRLFLSGAALVGMGLPTLTGCDLPRLPKRKNATSDSSAVGSTSTGGKSKAGSTEWQELDAHVMGHKVAVRVSPVIRKDEATSIIALEMTRAKDDASINEVSVPTVPKQDDSLSLHYYLGALSVSRQGNGASLVKLLDLEAGRVWSATDGSGGFLEVTPGEKITSYLSFGKVDADAVTVFVPMAGFVAVSVLEANAAKKAGLDLTGIQTELDEHPSAASKLAEPVAIERYTRALDDSTSTQAGGKDVTVTLASDVTFASDSADLTPAADTQIQTVSGQLAQYPEGGTLSIVGHTDDVQDDAYNQTLSERRANAVETRLEQRTSLNKWQTSVTGKGESQPRIKDTTDEARAANRRVEIILTPTSGTTKKNATATPNSGSGSLPEAKGPTAKGSDGVTVTSEGTGTSGEVAIKLDHVTRTGRYLLGQITIAIASGDGMELKPLIKDTGVLLSNQRGEDGNAISTWTAADGLTLISDSERIFPADYQDASAEQHLPLTDLHLNDDLKAGAVTTVCVVWPDPGGDTITLDHQGNKNTNDHAYRLTDIPVKNS